MGLFKRRQRAPVERLMAAIGLPTAGGELPVRTIVMEVATRSQARAGAALAVVEDLLGMRDDAVQVALDFLEDLQNVASHRLEGLITAELLLPLRGPRTVTAWQSVDRFWSDVAAWCDQNDIELKSSASLHTIENSQLRLHMWSSYRSLPDHRRVGLAHAIRYEKATGNALTVDRHAPTA